MSSKHNAVLSKHNTMSHQNTTQYSQNTTQISQNTTQYLRNTTPNVPDYVMQDVTIQSINTSLLDEVAGPDLQIRPHPHRPPPPPLDPPLQPLTCFAISRHFCSPFCLERMFCASCGAGLKSSSKFCHFCREKVANDTSTSETDKGATKCLSFQKYAAKKSEERSTHFRSSGSKGRGRRRKKIPSR